MRSQIIGALALNLGLVSAFQDASPFFLFSTSRLANTSLDSLNIASSTQVTSSVLKALESCSSQTYLLVEQPSARVSDFVNNKAAPTLRRQIQKEDERVLSSYTVQEVAGTIDVAKITQYLSAQCQTQQLSQEQFDNHRSSNGGSPPAIVAIQVAALPSNPKERAIQLRNNDDLLGSYIDTASARGEYTVLYITSPPSTSESPYTSAHTQQVYEMDELDFASADHIELKRDFNGHIRDDENKALPLFETYQFLSPGLFMAGTVSLILIVILYVGVNAIASLEVSYMAFSKEMGPAAQKKQA
ncbi:MAG: hypothetical protein M1822_003220 [Bathelium mastoideum]|nr:MAG: hypothetical protein M1822_003220 [Bathelium mastoideum]